MTAGSFIASFLDRLIAQGESAARLRTVVFDRGDSGGVEVFWRNGMRRTPYPSLRTVVLALRKLCNSRRLRKEQLKRIWFFSDRINVEYTDARGRSEAAPLLVSNVTLHETRASHLAAASTRQGRLARSRRRPGLAARTVDPEMPSHGAPAACLGPLKRRARACLGRLYLALVAACSHYTEVVEMAVVA